MLFQISSKCSPRDSSLKQIYCLSWNAWQQMTGHKFGLSKIFFIGGWLQFLIFCKATNTCSTKYKKHIHNYMKLLYFVTDICARKTVSHAIQWSLRKDKCAQSFRIDDKMFLSSVGQMWWIHRLGGSTINEIVIILLQAFFFLS